MKTLVSFALAATAFLSACATDEAQPHDGDATFAIGLEDYNVGSVFHETDGYLAVFMGPGVLADSNTSSGLPWIQFTLAYDKAEQIPYGISNLTLREGDLRMLVTTHGREPELDTRYATDGFVRVLSSSWGDVDGEVSVIEISGDIDVTLEDGRPMTGEFTAVRRVTSN